jgi:type IV secretion system protein VirB9
MITHTTIKKLHSCIFLVALYVILFAPHSALALRTSRPIPTDPRIHLMTYAPNEVFTYTGHYEYQSSIVFAANEKILTVSLGNADSWMMVNSGNRMFLKPVSDLATTNMTVITDKRLYQFELHARDVDPAKGLKDEHLVFEMRFVYPDDGEDDQLVFNNQNTGPDLSQPELYNFNYTMAGDDNIAPIRVFDDGEFTYFQFARRNAELPAFFHVENDNKESLINYRIQGDYVVLERVSQRLTLRAGNDVLCIFNESMPAPTKKKKQKK